MAKANDPGRPSAPPSARTTAPAQPTAELLAKARRSAPALDVPETADTDRRTTDVHEPPPELLARAGAGRRRAAMMPAVPAAPDARPSGKPSK